MGALACASVNNSWNVGDFKDITPLSYLHSNFKHIRGKEIPSAGRVFSVFLSHYRMSPHMVTSMEIYDLETEIVQWIFISHQWPSWPSLTDGTVCVFWKYLVHQYCLSPESSLSFKMSAAYVRVKTVWWNVRHQKDLTHFCTRTTNRIKGVQICDMPASNWNCVSFPF